MKVHAFAAMPQFARHLRPIWNALDPEIRGRFIEPEPRRRDVRHKIHGLVLVAGTGDAKRVAPAPVVYVEHGAGQSYLGSASGARGDYAGGDLPSNVVGVIGPNEAVASSRGRDLPWAAVGCPALDRWHSGQLQRSDKETSRWCFAFHWDALRVCPEARSAFQHWIPGLPEIIAALGVSGIQAAGTYHPRDAYLRPSFWNRLHVDVLHSPDALFSHADILVCDNSSIAAEFASLGRPVIWMNAPWYRRDVNHGGRFWDWTEGVPTFDSPGDLLGRIMSAGPWLGDVSPRWINGEWTEGIYAHVDGKASERAAAFVTDIASTM